MSIITSISQSRLKGMETPGNRLVIVHFQRIQDLRNVFICSNFTHQNRFIITITTLISVVYFKIMPFKINRFYPLLVIKLNSLHSHYSNRFGRNVFFCLFFHFHDILIIHKDVNLFVCFLLFHSAIVRNSYDLLLIFIRIYNMIRINKSYSIQFLCSSSFQICISK